ncbi:hypothetical protein PY365_23745, partial [Roseiarcaceae bacterium H3SJ34-1]|nr:hypothetical protein [Roseiarcaceae bacterium H3SJ34-1]
GVDPFRVRMSRQTLWINRINTVHLFKKNEPDSRGLWQALRGRLVWPVSAAIGLGIGGIMGWFGQIEVDELGPSPLPVVMATCCAATLVCWYIVRNFIGGRIEPQ